VLGTALAELLDLATSLPPDLAPIDQPVGSGIELSGQQKRAGGKSSVEEKSECLKAIMKGFLFGLSVDSVRQESLVCARECSFISWPC
jgi:hypothetical protein